MTLADPNEPVESVAAKKTRQRQLLYLARKAEGLSVLRVIGDRADLESAGVETGRLSPLDADAPGQLEQMVSDLLRRWSALVTRHNRDPLG